MNNTARNDISDELDDWEIEDTIDALSERRERKQDQAASLVTGTIDKKGQEDNTREEAQQSKNEGETKSKLPDEAEGNEREEAEKKKRKEEADKKKREQQEAKKKREVEERTRKERERQAQLDRWITPSFKVKESRATSTEQIFYTMKGSGVFSGTKQQFYDEGLEYLAEKYKEYAKQ